MKKLAVLIATLLFFVFAPLSYAQETTPSAGTADGGSIIISPSIEDITGDTQTVNVQFNDLVGKQFYACLHSNGCVLREKGSQITIEGTGINVCADGDNKLKIVDSECGENDYFHEGKTYRISLFRDSDMEVMEAETAFYINHFYPEVTVGPPNPTLDTPIEVTLTGTRLPPNKGSNNNYQIVVQGSSGYKQERCITVKPDAPGIAKFGIPKEESNPTSGLATGKYTIKVNERVSDDRPLGVGNTCEGGFTFWHVPFSVSVNGGEIGVPEKDPNGSDIRNLQKLLDSLGKESASIIPCEEGKPNPGLLECKALDTSIGSIPLNPVGFITRIFQIVLAVAGLGAMLLILYAGYRLLISRGDKEIVQAQRERITSAIVGLLFIIFSLVLLSVIAGDVLKLPGFNANPLPGQTITR